MSALTLQSSTQPEQRSEHEAFVLRAAGVNQLIDTKCNFEIEKARLQNVAETNPDVRERCEVLIKTLSRHIETLQEQIDRDLKGLMHGILKAPAPSRSMDSVPG